jgi:hypothetical protein
LTKLTPPPTKNCRNILMPAVLHAPIAMIDH